MSRFEQRVRRRLATDREYRVGFEEGVAEFNLAAVLDEARQERHLTKAELARRMGVEHAFVSRHLNHPQNLKLATLASFLESLGKRADIVIHDARPHQPTIRVVPKRQRRRRDQVRLRADST
jgi:transcriptional regulator with XRE-family HTH domain